MKQFIRSLLVVTLTTACASGNKQSEPAAQQSETKTGGQPIRWPQVTIKDADKLGAAVKDKALELSFTVEGGGEDFKYLCRGATRAEIKDAEKSDCVDTFAMEDLAENEGYFVEIYAVYIPTGVEEIVAQTFFSTAVFEDEIFVLNEDLLRIQRSGVVFLAFTLKSKRAAYYTCATVTPGFDPTLDCRDGKLMMQINRYAGGYYLIVDAYDPVTNEKIAEKSMSYCGGQLCAQNLENDTPPSPEPQGYPTVLYPSGSVNGQGIPGAGYGGLYDAPLPYSGGIPVVVSPNGGVPAPMGPAPCRQTGWGC